MAMAVGIVAKRGSERAVEVVEEIAAVLAAENCRVRADEAVAAAIGVPGVPPAELADCDFVVSVGGDGTLLHAVTQVGGTPILGINLGEVGFLNPVPPADARRAVLDALAETRTRGRPSFREAIRLAARGPDWSLSPALNEVVVMGTRRGRGGGLDLEVTVDGQPYGSGHTDGVLVATPTGSTAYNLSEGGPLVHPSVPAMVITEMVPADPMPPLVVAPDHLVTISARGADEAVVVADGGDRRRIALPGAVTIERADEPARIAGPGSEFFTALEKLD